MSLSGYMGVQKPLSENNFKKMDDQQLLQSLHSLSIPLGSALGAFFGNQPISSDSVISKVTGISDTHQSLPPVKLIPVVVREIRPLIIAEHNLNVIETKLDDLAFSGRKQVVDRFRQDHQSLMSTDNRDRIHAALKVAAATIVAQPTIVQSIRSGTIPSVTDAIKLVNSAIKQETGGPGLSAQDIQAIKSILDQMGIEFTPIARDTDPVDAPLQKPVQETSEEKMAREANTLTLLKNMSDDIQQLALKNEQDKRTQQGLYGKNPTTAP